MERLYKFAENGGIELNKEVEEKETKQKNYIIDVEVAGGIKALAKKNKVTEGRMVEEMYYTFMELLERGEKAKKTNKKTTNKTNSKEEDKQKEVEGQEGK